MTQATIDRIVKSYKVEYRKKSVKVSRQKCFTIFSLDNGEVINTTGNANHVNNARTAWLYS